MNIIEQMKMDILNGEELQYDYEIDGVSIIVITDDYPWVTILAGGTEWETYVGNEHYDGLSLDDTLDELAKFIEYESIKSTITTKTLWTMRMVSSPRLRSFSSTFKL